MTKTYWQETLRGQRLEVLYSEHFKERWLLVNDGEVLLADQVRDLAKRLESLADAMETWPEPGATVEWKDCPDHAPCLWACVGWDADTPTFVDVEGESPSVLCEGTYVRARGPEDA